MLAVLVGHRHGRGVETVVGIGVAGAREVEIVAPRGTVLVAPSPQAMTTVCVSRRPDR